MTKTLFITFLILATSFKAQKVSRDTVIVNTFSKKDNYVNSVNWSSFKNKELNQKEIVSKDQELGFVNTDILIKLYDESSAEYYYSYTMRIDSKDQKYKISINNPVIRVRMSSMDLTELPVSTLKRYRNYLQVLINLITNQFDEKMEWNYDDMLKVAYMPNIPQDQKDILLKIISKSNTINSMLLSDCIDAMKKDSNW